MAKKEIKFDNAKRVEPIRQEEKANGQIGEKIVWTSVDIDSDLYKKLKIYLVSKGVSMKDILLYWINNALEGKITLPLPKEEKSTAITKRPFYIPQSKKTELKKWLTEHDVSMRDVIEYSIRQELNKKQA